MITIPTTEKKYSQTNSSDLKGNIFATKNITFDDDGYIKLSPSSRAGTNESVADADWNFPAVIIPSEDFEYFIETRDHPFDQENDVLGSVAVEITASDNPANGALGSDATFFGGLMPVTKITMFTIMTKRLIHGLIPISLFLLQRLILLRISSHLLVGLLGMELQLDCILI